MHALRLRARPVRPARGAGGAASRFEADRARGWYDRGLALLPLLDRRSRACVAAMAGIYHRLLDRDRRRPGAVLRGGCRCTTGAEGLASPPAACCRSRSGHGHDPAPIVRRRRRAGRHGRGPPPAPTPAPTVTLRRAAPRLGGATWSFPRNGLRFDNGQHVFMRCCTEYRAFLDRIGVGRPGAPAGPPRRAGASPPAAGRPAAPWPPPAGARSTSAGRCSRYRHLTPATGCGRSARRWRCAGSTSTTAASTTSTFGDLAGRPRPVHRRRSAALWDLDRPPDGEPAVDEASLAWPPRCSAPACSTAPTPPTSAGRACRSASCTATPAAARSSGPASRSLTGAPVAAVDGPGGDRLGVGVAGERSSPPTPWWWPCPTTRSPALLPRRSPAAGDVPSGSARRRS